MADKRLIDACKLEDEFYHMPELVYTDAIARYIEIQPTVDAVQVVRCKDCRYAKDYYNDGSIYCCIPGKLMEWHDDDPNWYCADGERKDGDTDDKARDD